MSVSRHHKKRKTLQNFFGLDLVKVSLSSIFSEFSRSQSLDFHDFITHLDLCECVYPRELQVEKFEKVEKKRCEKN